MTIGARDGGAVGEARRRIEMILDPPKAEVGAVYRGKVVNVTKFGAFVNILPGRDGLVHISKLGRGKRVDRVEDVVDLGDEIEVRVDDIDPQGKVSLSLVGDAPEPVRAEQRQRKLALQRVPTCLRPASGAGEVSFEDTWEAEAPRRTVTSDPAQVGGGEPGGSRGRPRTPAEPASAPYPRASPT